MPSEMERIREAAWMAASNAIREHAPEMGPIQRAALAQIAVDAALASLPDRTGEPVAFADPAVVGALFGTPGRKVYLSKNGSNAYSMALYDRPSDASDHRWERQSKQATSVIAMIRAMIGEMFGPVIESEEATLLRGPEAKHSGEAILEALQKIASRLDATPPDAEQARLREQVVVPQKIVDDVLDMALYLPGCAKDRIEHYQDAANRLANWAANRNAEARLAQQAERATAVTEAGDWAIDQSTGTDILTYKQCSVIEDEQAHFVIGLVEAALAEPQQAVTEADPDRAIKSAMARGAEVRSETAERIEAALRTSSTGGKG